eukprot:111118_1
MLSREEEPDVDVRLEDQKLIHQYGWLNWKMEELKVDKKALLEECGNLDDASTQMVLGEGEEIQLLLGEALVLVDEDYAMEYCSKKQDAVNDRLNDLEKKEKDYSENMERLKKILYGRFGSSINLES